MSDALPPSPPERPAFDIAPFEEGTAAFRQGVADARAPIAELTDAIEDVRQRVSVLLASWQQDVEDRLALAGVPHDTLRDEGLALEGLPSQRLRVRRVTYGDPVARPFTPSMGLTRCVTDAPDVRTRWANLLQYEAECPNDVLEGLPATIFDVPGAEVSSRPEGLRVVLRECPGDPVVSLPRFTHALAGQKHRNFGHWLLDCVPQVMALNAVAPGTKVLLPDPVRSFHRSTLALAGIAEEQLIPWNGTPVRASRLLVFYSDGRLGGGRPLSSLLAFRRLVAPPASTRKPWRRIYVSRRGARSRRRWVVDEAAVEALFARYGFEILLMEEVPLAQQIQLFREAAVVAGVSGAGLSDLLFASAGTHVIVLVTDSLIRWYAEGFGARTLWTTHGHAHAQHLSSLGDSPRFYAHVAAAFDQVCHSFVCGDDVPLEQLASFVGDALRQAGHSQP